MEGQIMNELWIKHESLRGRADVENTAYVSLRKKFCSECGGKMVEYEL